MRLAQLSNSHCSARFVAQRHCSGTATCAPVNPALIEHIVGMLRRSQSRQLPLSHLYSSLTPEMRKECVRPHKTLSLAIQTYCKLSQSKGNGATQLFLSPDLLSVSLSRSLNETQQQKHEQDPTMGSSAESTPVNPPPLRCWSGSSDLPPNPLLFPFPTTYLTSSIRVGDGPHVCAAVSAPSRSPGAMPEGSNPGRDAAVLLGEPHDFYFPSWGLSEVPPAPPPIAPAPVKTLLDSDTSISVSGLTSYVPTFFVPVKELIRVLPEGYTEAHVEHYLQGAKTIQMVTVEDVKYLRIVGGYGQVDLAACLTAADHFRMFEPDPSLVDHFVAAFEGVRERWMPLPLLLSRVDPQVTQRLPYHGPAAILFFAQMQHIFNFSPSDGGAVLLRAPGYRGLDALSTPTPAGFGRVLNSIPDDEFVDLDVLASAQPQETMNEICRYFPSFEAFLRSHSSTFHVEAIPVGEATKLSVCRARYKQRLDIKSRPLHEQLAYHESCRQKKKARSLRRKLALMKHADNPLMDRNLLAQEIHKSLPTRGHIRLKDLLRSRLAEDVALFLPKNYIRFFAGFPDLFQVFELGSATNWCIARSGLPLPHGALRKDYTDEDVLRVLAELLSRTGPRSVSYVMLYLPEGVSKAIRTRHADLVSFAAKYPQYLNAVLPFDKGNARSAAIIHLLQLPTGMASASAPGDERGTDRDDVAEEDDEEDEHISV